MSRVHSTKKKILFFVPLPPPVHGAALRNKSLIESKLIQRHFIVEVIPFSFANEIEDIGKFSVVKLAKVLQRTVTIIVKLISFRPSLVYFNISLYGFALYRDTFFVMLFKLFRMPLLFHLRTQGVRRQVAESRFKRALFSYLFDHVNVICLSKSLVTDISEVFRGAPMIVNNGLVDLNPGGIQRRNDNVKPIILFLSNLSVAKGVLDLIESFCILKDRGIHFEGWIVGPSGDLSVIKLKEIISRNNLHEVSLLGASYGEEKLKMFGAADLFVLPTHFEAFPGVVLEAMQFYLPVIASKEGAIPDIVDDEKTGLLIEKSNPIGLADALERLLKDKNVRRSMGLAAREKFVAHYTIERFEQSMITALSQVIE